MDFIKKYWIGVCSVIAIGISGLILYRGYLGYHSYPSDAVAETVGRCLACALVGFFVIKSVRQRLGIKKFEFFILCFSVAFSLYSAYEFVKTKRESRQLNNAQQEMARLAREYSDGITSKESANSYSAEKYGDLGKLIPIIKRSFESYNKMKSEINEASVDLDGILTPANLCDSEQIIKAKSIIRKLSNKLNKFERQYNEELVRVESDIKEAYSGDCNLKNHALRGFEKGKTEGRKLIAEYLFVERSAIQTIEDILNFLSNKTGSFWESDGGLAFKKDADATTFNLLVEKLAEHIKIEDAMMHKLEQHQQSTLQKFQEDCS